MAGAYVPDRLELTKGADAEGSLLIEHNETVNAILWEMDMGDVLVFTNDEAMHIRRRGNWIKNVLHYKKASLFCLIFSVAFLSCSTVAFATAGGESQERGNNLILDVLIEDQTGNREILEQRIKEARRMIEFW